MTKKNEVKKFKAQLNLDPMLWKRFKRYCACHDTHASTQVEKIIIKMMEE